MDRSSRLHQLMRVNVTGTKLLALFLLCLFGLQLSPHEIHPLGDFVDVLAWGRLMVLVGALVLLLDDFLHPVVKTALTLPWHIYVFWVVTGVISPELSWPVRTQFLGLSVLWLYLIWRRAWPLCQLNITPLMVMAAGALAYGVAWVLRPGPAAVVIWNAYQITPIELSTVLVLSNLTLLVLAPALARRTQAALTVPYAFCIYATESGVVFGQIMLAPEYVVVSAGLLALWYYLILWRQAYQC